MNFDMLKQAAKWANTAGNHELYTKILEAQLMASELLEENQKLKGELQKRDELDRQRNAIELRENFYFPKNEVAPPYCTRCWDVEKKLVTCHSSGVIEGFERAVCPNCKLEKYLY